TAAPIRSVGNLPTTDYKVGGATDAGHVLFAATEGQFIDGTNHKNVVSAEVVGAVADLRIHREVIIVVVVCMREGVVREELQALREALLQLHLKCIVMRAGVVPEVVVNVG